MVKNKLSKFIYPNYNNGSIVNLMKSIFVSFDKTGCISKNEFMNYYDTLKIINNLRIDKSLNEADNILLVVVDGFGYKLYEYFKNKISQNYKISKGRDDIKISLEPYFIDKITSVFPTTTAACISTFLSGLPPQQTGIYSWYMQMKELGMIVRILPFTARCEEVSLLDSGVDPYELINSNSFGGSFFEKINLLDSKVESFCLQPRAYSKGGYNKEMCKGAKEIGYRGYNNLLREINRIIKNDFYKIEKKSKSNNKSKKYIYSYLPLIDYNSHYFGTNSSECFDEFILINTFFKKLITNLKGTNTKIVITADHGLINTPPKKQICFSDDKELYDCFSMPLSGEARAVSCFVRIDKKDDFLKIINDGYADSVIVKTRKEIIDDGYFGLGAIHDKLEERIGDYVLLVKENYVIKDFLLNDEHAGDFFNAYHGGLSEDEIYVPLFFIDCLNL
jgi:hypothetical protein